jgi:hypothetical protein
MIASHRTLLWGQAAGGLAVNLFLNGAVAWWTFPPVAKLPLGTSFFLPLVTCLVLTTVVRRMLRAKRMDSVPRSGLPIGIRLWPQHIVGRGAIVGLLSILLCALPTLALLTQLGIESMSRGEVTTYKAIYTAVLGVLVTPLFGWRALADQP